MQKSVFWSLGCRRLRCEHHHIGWDAVTCANGLKMPGDDALNDLVNATDPLAPARTLNAWFAAHGDGLSKTLSPDGKDNQPTFHQLALAKFARLKGTKPHRASAWEKGHGRRERRLLNLE